MSNYSRYISNYRFVTKRLEGMVLILAEPSGDLASDKIVTYVMNTY